MRQSLGAFFQLRFGRCAKCMRLAMLCFVLSLIGYFTLTFAGAYPVLAGPLLVAAIATGALTTLHILVFAWRFGLPSHHRAAIVPVKTGKGPVAPVPVFQATLSRRDATRMFFRVAMLAALATLPLPKRARAACGDCAATYGGGWYDCITYFCNTQGQTGCPPGSPYLNHCDCLCYDTTDFNCGSYSACQYCG